jgi:hypothetical protein
VHAPAALPRKKNCRHPQNKEEKNIIIIIIIIIIIDVIMRTPRKSNRALHNQQKENKTRTRCHVLLLELTISL